MLPKGVKILPKRLQHALSNGNLLKPRACPFRVIILKKEHSAVYLHSGVLVYNVICDFIEVLNVRRKKKNSGVY